MKQFILIYTLLIVILVLFGCKSNDGDPAPDTDPTETQRVTGLLTKGSWKIQSVSIDGTDHLDLFKDMTLTFTSGSFSTTHGTAVWPASGTWNFVSDQAQSIKRGDSVVIDLNTVNETTLVATLTWSKSTLGSGRTNSLAGKHVFTFSK